jgi:hypothetical protein
MAMTAATQFTFRTQIPLGCTLADFARLGGPEW